MYSVGCTAYMPPKFTLKAGLFVMQVHLAAWMGESGKDKRLCNAAIIKWPGYRGHAAIAMPECKWAALGPEVQLK